MASTISTCCATAAWDACSAGCGRPRRWAPSCAPFTHGHVQQLDKINAALLAGLAARVPGLLAGSDAQGITFVDVDDTHR